MPLRIELKPGEKVFIGGAVIENGSGRTHLTVLNEVPVLRERDILTETSADTPCKRIYLAVQLMYMDEQHLPQHHQSYWQLVKQVLEAAPSTLELLDRMSGYILNRQYYQALKGAKELISYEQDLLKHAE
ncbi:MAG: flagellar biosynthesis repressor FlbT [Betaproteobacteria bacterium]|nr:flagellar biosynthesis repressor FlbT [Betaproteobacteria bacterium]